MTAKKKWFAVRTKNGGEYLAETELRRAGMDGYLPQYRREYQHHRSKRWIVRSFPLFQGYIFVADPVFASLRWLDGIAKEGALADEEGRPLLIPEDVIAEIQRCEATGEFDELKRQGYKLANGEMVTMKDGALAGATALVKSVKSAKNLQLIVPLFGGVVARSTIARISKAA